LRSSNETRQPEALRRGTEQRWTDNPRLNEAGGGPGCDDSGSHDNHHRSGFQDHDFGEVDDGEEWM
jgi:hypothetical protein